MNYMDSVRKQNGFLTVTEIEEVIVPNNTVFDIYSLLISRNAKVGNGNIFYPNILIECDSNSSLYIGNNNEFHSGLHLVALKGGVLSIGDDNLFNDGIICVKSNMDNSNIEIGNETRLEGLINVFGRTKLGSGSQILGNISVYSCVLCEGGSYKTKIVEQRAGLLKGNGTAKGLRVDRGMVIYGSGSFDAKAIEPQLNYHKS